MNSEESFSALNNNLSLMDALMQQGVPGSDVENLVAALNQWRQWREDSSGKEIGGEKYGRHLELLRKYGEQIRAVLYALESE